MKKLMLIMILIAGLYLLSAQNSVFNSSQFNGGNLSSSLFNPYKMKMSHSMGFTAGSSSNGQGFYESRYTNHISYQFNPKLDMALDLNFVNFGSTSSTKSFNISSNDDNKTKILPGFTLNYKPSENVFFRFEYKQLHDSYNPWLGRGTNWWE
jgi:hypothetical protein